MKFALTRPRGGKTYYLDLEELEFREMKDYIRNNALIEVKDDLFPGGGCTLDRVGEDNDLNTSSRLIGDAFDTFKISPGDTLRAGFWQKVLNLNMTQKYAYVWPMAVEQYAFEGEMSKADMLVDLDYIFQEILSMPAEWLERYNKKQVPPVLDRFRVEKA